ncbi:hypothetical protein Tco_0347193, partial [Tanacetum coccineum]
MGTQTDKASVYDSDRSVECRTKWETVDQHPATVEENRAYFESLYNNLAIEVEKVNTVNRKVNCVLLLLEEKKKVEPQQQNQQSLYNGKVLLEKHDPPAVYDSEETLQLAQESREKMKQLNKEIKPTNYTNINHLLGVFVSQTAKSREELYFSNTSKTANVSKSISIPNEEFSDDTTPSVARKFLNEALGLEIERLLRAVVSQDIMSIMQSNSVVDTSNLQTELERTKE